jgi:hypothetical protein
MLISLILMSFGNRLLNIVASFAFRGIVSVCVLKKHISTIPIKAKEATIFNNLFIKYNLL